LSDKDSEIDGSERSSRSAPSSYTEVFYKQFPYYLSIGMTEYQYWDSDCKLVQYYREAEELRVERMNQFAWLQGGYFYDAISKVAPILHAFAKKGTKSQPYLEQPYPITKRAAEEKEIEEEKSRASKAKQFMEMFMVKTNRYFEERK
jgi:hypothetical protein